MKQQQVNQAFGQAFEQIEQEFSGLSRDGWARLKEHELNMLILQKKIEIAKAFGHEFDILYHRLFETFIVYKKNKAFNGQGVGVSNVSVVPLNHASK